MPPPVHRVEYVTFGGRSMDRAFTKRELDYQLRRIRDWAAEAGKAAQKPTRLYWRTQPELEQFSDWMLNTIDHRFYFRLQTIPPLPQELVDELHARRDRLANNEPLEYPQ